MYKYNQSTARYYFLFSNANDNCRLTMNVHLLRTAFRRQTLSSVKARVKPTARNGINTLCTLASSSSSPWEITRTRPTRMMFSTENDSSASETLSDLLQRELEEEDHNESATMPADLAALKTQIEEKWRFVEGMLGDDGATVKLFRKDSDSAGGKVSITFHCQDTITAEDADEDYEEEDDQEETAALRFVTTVTKASKTMVLTCLSQNAEVKVESVAFTDADPESAATNGVDESLYQGPEYSELAEDVQEAFDDFVQSDCGIDEDVAGFIAMYADYREQVEYVRWLKVAKGILQ